MEIYARQVNMLFQRPDLFYEKHWSGMYVQGSDHDFGDTGYLFGSVGKVLCDVCNVAAEIERGYSSYNSIAEYLNYYVPRADKRNYTAEELKEWKHCAELYSNIGTPIEDQLAAFKKSLELVSGTEYAWGEICGCGKGQQDWVFYPTNKYSKDDVSAFECEYYDMGTEWVIDNTGVKPESPDKIEGHSFYCQNTSMDKIHQEIAAAFGCRPDEVHLYSYHEQVIEHYEPEQEESEDTEDYSPEM